jgi:hypothetical protein
MTYTNGKAFKPWGDKKKAHFNITEEASQRGEEEAASSARQAEWDNIYSGRSGLN